MSSRIKILEVCVRGRLLYSAQSLELTASELNKLETIWHGFLGKMVANGFKRKNVPVEYLKARKDAKKSNVTVTEPKEAFLNFLAEPDDLDWSFVYNNTQLRTITETKNFNNFFVKCST